jgi:HlyD family secretion protein
MRVDVNIVTDRKAGVLVIDAGAAFNGKGRQPAFAVRDGVARKTLLELGASDGKVVEVVAGAQPGERSSCPTPAPSRTCRHIRISN